MRTATEVRHVGARGTEQERVDAEFTAYLHARQGALLRTAYLGPLRTPAGVQG